MDTLQVLIVDDEPLARSRLRALLGQCREPQALIAGEAASADAALSTLERSSVDVLLLDIHMPGMDGLKMAQALQGRVQAPQVIFVTAYAEHALAAFDLEALDYLTKPVRLERLQASLRKAQRALMAAQTRMHVEPDHYLVINERGRVLRVPLSEVLYLKAELKYITVGTATRQYLLDDSLNHLEEQFPERFIRIHRNALVARHAIREVLRHHDATDGEGWSVKLDGIDQKLLVSRRQIAALKDALSAP